MGVKSNKPVTVNIEDLSEYLIYRSNFQKIPFTPLKLQKILYFLQAWHLVYFDKHPFFNEVPEAWANGPVYRVVYNKYKKKWLKNDPILVSYKSENELTKKVKDLEKGLKITAQQKKLMELVLNTYLRYTPEKLIIVTHLDEPYIHARKGYDTFDACEVQINLDEVFNYYNKKKKITKL